jgi:hypothetical protein
VFCVVNTWETPLLFAPRSARLHAPVRGADALPSVQQQRARREAKSSRSMAKEDAPPPQANADKGGAPAAAATTPVEDVVSKPESQPAPAQTTPPATLHAAELPQHQVRVRVRAHETLADGREGYVASRKRPHCSSRAATGASRAASAHRRRAPLHRARARQAHPPSR